MILNDFNRQTKSITLRKQLCRLKNYFAPCFNEEKECFEPTNQPIAITLENVSYLITDKIGNGDESDVYKIIRQDNNKAFALKVYYIPDEAKGDALIKEKAKAAIPYLNMPLVVDTKNGYSIAPLHQSHFSCEENNTSLMTEIENMSKKVSAALKKDGLYIGDNLNAGNYITTKEGALKRIDFASVATLAQRSESLKALSNDTHSASRASSKKK